MNQPTHRRSRPRRKSPTLPELEQAKAAVLNSLASLQSRRSYDRAMKEFIAWYCSEPRLALNRSVVLRYRLRPPERTRFRPLRRPARGGSDGGLLDGKSFLNIYPTVTPNIPAWAGSTKASTP